ncbi:MAG TPA: ABC transporter permease [Acidimicrobiia bacterium]|jgi:simple sugar transport system permease protein
MSDRPDGAADSPGFIEDLLGTRLDWRRAVLVPVLAILLALMVSAVIIVVSDIDLWQNPSFDQLGDTLDQARDALSALFIGSFGSLRAFSSTLEFGAPLIFAGLAVAIGFHAGLFNIGAEGQMLMGGMAAVALGITFDLPIYLNLPLALVGGAIGGGIWGGIAGWLRAKTGAHEVVTTIMLNSIAGLAVVWMLSTSFFQPAGRQDPVSRDIATSARLPRLLGFLDRSDLRVHFGIILALIAAYGIYWLLFKSTIGFEFRAVGANPDAAHYAGMRVTTIYVSVMFLSGALAGLAGMNQINGLLFRASPGFSAGIGFDAISLALLGRSHPAGVVAAGLLFGALRAGGLDMQVVTDVPIDLIAVIQALVVVFIAAPALIRAIFRVRTGEGTGQVTKGWAS